MQIISTTPIPALALKSSRWRGIDIKGQGTVVGGTTLREHSMTQDTPPTYMYGCIILGHVLVQCELLITCCHARFDAQPHSLVSGVVRLTLRCVNAGRHSITLLCCRCYHCRLPLPSPATTTSSTTLEIRMRFSTPQLTSLQRC